MEVESVETCGNTEENAVGIEEVSPPCPSGETGPPDPDSMLNNTCAAEGRQWRTD